MYLYKCVYHRKKTLSPVQLEYIRAADKVKAYTEFCRRRISEGWSKGEILQDAEVEIIRDVTNAFRDQTEIYTITSNKK
mgnify:FL=1